MKHLLLTVLSLFSLQSAMADIPASQVDSAWLFSYATLKNGGRNGLHFAWSTDLHTWHEIGPEWAPVKSDYGTWGAQKRMYNPELSYDAETGLWQATWRVNNQENVVATTQSRNLYQWKPQDYNTPEYLASRRRRQFDENSTPSAAAPGAVSLTLPFSGAVQGQVHRVAWSLVDGLLTAWQLQQQKDRENGERATDDKQGRFARLQPQTISVRVDTAATKTISDKLVGIFFEDINYAADGGLYAELVQNRDFEYSSIDYSRRDTAWNALSAWQGLAMQVSVDTVAPIHANNPHYAVLQVPAFDAKSGSILHPSFQNGGYDGIAVQAGKKYNLSLFGRMPEGTNGQMRVVLAQSNGTTVAEGTVKLPKGQQWRQVKVVLKANATAADCRLILCPQAGGLYHLDMVSLFPQDTYKGRANGMRRDLAEALEALHPQFVRFPGGCASHGNGIDNMYRWKNTIGPLESRKPNWNIWRYHQTVGLGYFEYFQLCEDLGARPLPVLAAGVPCQNSSVGGAGQQGGIPMDQMPEYVQEVLDLIDYANGDPKTNQWARKRAEAGHPKPFGLTMIGIGNEDLISDVFTERYRMICEAVAKAHPEIEIVGTVGPWCEGSDYEWGWKLAREMNLSYVDEHYYNSPGWFINHQDYYDRYKRGGTKVYLGEYASHIPGRANCLETALSEALYLCSVERNGDVVEMTSYAPLLAKKGHTQWNPDMIYFTNTDISLTSGYQVQRLFGQNAGTRYVGSLVQLEHPDGKAQQRIGSSVVYDAASGQYILKLVNYLPVENQFNVTLPDGIGQVVSAQVLTGELKDTNAVPADFTDKVAISTSANSPVASFKAPAYSFVVIRVK